MKKVIVLMLVSFILSACNPEAQTIQPQRVATPEDIVPVGTPMPEQTATEILRSWDLEEGEKVNILQVSAAGIQDACNPEDAYLFWQHIAVNHLREFPEVAVITIFEGIASGTIQPDKVVGDSSRAVIKITALGQKWLFITGKAVKSTMYVVTDARYVASMLKGVAVSAKPLAKIAVCVLMAYKTWVRDGRPPDPDSPVRDVTPVPVRLPEPNIAMPTVEPSVVTTAMTVQGQQVVFLGNIDLSPEEVAVLMTLGVVVVVGVIIATGGSGAPILVLAIL